MNRRNMIMDQLPENSTLLVAGEVERYMSHDVPYAFRQDSDFFYLTGFNEPNAIAVLGKKRHGDPISYTLFVPPKDPASELWDGPRSGVEGAKLAFGADEAYSVGELGSTGIDSTIPTNDSRQELGVEQGATQGDVALLCALSGGRELFATEASQRRKEVQGVMPPGGFQSMDLLLQQLRSVKSPAEVGLMSRAGDVVAAGHLRAMEAAQPGMTEFQLASVLESSMKWDGAEREAFPSVVAGGVNACTLHYVSNSQVLRDGDLVLVDAGAELGGYCSDVTRTWPVNGRFTAPQEELYEAVLDCHRRVIDAAKPGTSIRELTQLAAALLCDAMCALGILSGTPDQALASGAFSRFFPHAVGHQLGGDVHDLPALPRDTPFLPGMVITVEPGLYVPPSALDVPERFRGLGVRIEDDVLIESEGLPCRVLTTGVPTCPRDLEQIIGSKGGLMYR